LIATYQNTVLSAGREVQTPLRGFLRSREQAEDLDRSVKAATAATQLGVQQYRTGIIDFNRVFNLETTQVQQQDQLAIAAGNIALNLVNVYRALGGGWELRRQQEQLQLSANSEHADARGAPLETPAVFGPASLPEPLPAPRP
jgi:outer membrane protein TolC